MKELESLTPELNEGDPLADYRPISRLAIVALLAGLFSAIAFADPLLLVVPLGSAVLAGFTLFHLSRSRVSMVGHSAALAGLMLSLVFGTWAGARDWTRQRVLFREAETIGRQWLELVRDGSLHEAHQLNMPQNKRAEPGASLEKEYEKQTHGPSEMISFRDTILGPELLKLDPQTSIRLLTNESVIRNGKTDEITQSYRLDYDRDGRHQSLVVQMVLKRTAYPFVGESQWEVGRISTTIVP